MVAWVDSRGWKYKVMGYLDGTYQGRYQDDRHCGDVGWEEMRQMERRGSFDFAQEDLNTYAKKRGWHPIGINMLECGKGIGERRQ